MFNNIKDNGNHIFEIINNNNIKLKKDVNQ